MSLVSAIRPPAEWLDDIAARLKAHSWVGSARVGFAADGMSDRVSGPATAFILPSVEGVHALRTSGKGRMTIELQRWLRAGGDADLPEIEFRLVESLPADGSRAVDGDCRRPWMPIVDGIALDQRGFSCTLLVPYELPIFRGHFPERPIVPGVMQVGWAATLARQHQLAEGPLTGVPTAKFSRLVRPGMRLVARIESGSKAGLVQFQYSAGVTAVASGRLQFGVARE